MNSAPLSPKSRWGIYLFLPAAATALCCLMIPLWLVPQRHSVFYRRIVPWTGLSGAVVSMLIGHFSYPRVHSFKVFWAGYLTAVIGLIWFILIDPPWPSPPAPPGFTTAVLLTSFANLLAAHCIPSLLRYQLTKALTLWLAAVEAFAAVVVRFTPGLLSWTRPLSHGHILDPAFWIGPAWFALVIGIGMRRLRSEFQLAGALAAAAWCYLLAWTSPAFFANYGEPQMLICAATPLMLSIGIVIHCFLSIEHRDCYDPLLHIFNRNYCSRIISEQSKLDTQPPLAVAMIDIDHFKQVNDTYGHQAGDAVLMNTAQVICRCVGSDGVVCRYGGEEMAVFFPQRTTKDVVAVLEKVRQEVEKITTVVRNKKIKATVSIGVAHRADRSQSIIDVIHAADKALYRAKEGGRNQVRTGKTPMPTAKKKAGKEKHTGDEEC